MDPDRGRQWEIATSQAENQTYSQAAPWCDIPPLRIVSVEHPFIIKNIDKGVETLGGNNSIAKIVGSENKDQTIGLYVRPEDRMSKALFSHAVITRNVVLQITVPKRTGRRRKIGSSGPYLEPSAVNMPLFSSIGALENPQSFRQRKESDAGCLLQSLKDNKASYKVEPVGAIEQTHRFRGMLDFVYSTTKSPFMAKMRENILPFQYDKMKRFSLDLSKGVKVDTDLIPPPTFSHITTPFMYSYRQNPAVKQSVDDAGHQVTINTQVATKILTQLVSYDVPNVPSGPPSDAASFDSLDPTIQRVITQLRSLLDERPIWTRRALLNHISSKEYAYTLKQSFQYVGYMFRSGPWRDAVIRFGVDPRTDPKYRIYQTLMFQMHSRESEAGSKAGEDERTSSAKVTSGKGHNIESHIFNGQQADMKGRVWQVCDITDPLLRSLLDTRALRDECDIRSDGWYHNGTWAKTRIIMKAKLKKITEGGIPSNVDYSRLLEIPDIINASTRQQAVLKGKKTPQEVQWASDIRMLASLPAKRKPHGPDLEVAQGTDALSQDGGIDGGETEEGASSPALDSRVAETLLQLDRSGHFLSHEGPNNYPDIGTTEDVEDVDAVAVEDVDAVADEEVIDERQ